MVISGELEKISDKLYQLKKFRPELAGIVLTALSPKLFIFNDNVILQPLFPTDKIRLGVRLK